MQRLYYLKDVVTLHLDEVQCTGCGMCSIVCPHGVFQMSDARARIGERDACMECGACAMNCPTGAVTVQSGVGCAAAVINSLLGRESSSCCCILEPAGDDDPSADRPRRSTCC